MSTTEVVYSTPDNSIIVPESRLNPLIEQVCKERAEIEAIIAIKREPTPSEKALADEKRKFVKKYRCLIENNRKEIVEDAVRFQRNANSIAKEYTAICENWEAGLTLVATYHDRLEAEKKAKLTAEREIVLREFVEDVKAYNVADMSNELWDITINGLKVAREQKLAAQKKLEEEAAAKAKAEAEEREKMRLENERLRKEAQEAEAAAKKEREAAAAEAAKLRALAEDEKRKAEAAAKKVEDDRLAALAAEEKRKKEEAEAAERVASAPDKTKILAIALAIKDMNYPDMATDKGRVMLSFVKTLVNEVALKIQTEAEKL